MNEKAAEQRGFNTHGLLHQKPIDQFKESLVRCLQERDHVLFRCRPRRRPHPNPSKRHFAETFVELLKRFLENHCPSLSPQFTSFVAHSRQPWASRTAIIAARMLFHVCGFIMTSLGNMQPSQQTCLNFRVTLP